jgi:hypothetical protein
MTRSTDRPALAAREPGRALYGHAAGLLAAARGLEAESRDAEAASALAPTLACVEATLDAVGEATARLGNHVVDRWLPIAPGAAGEAADAIHRLRDSLEQSRRACMHARVTAQSVLLGAGDEDNGS